MATFLVGYDLHPAKGETYGELIKAIENVGTDWWHCLDSTWLVVSNKSAPQIRDELWKHMKADDQLLVAKLAQSPNHDVAWNGFSERCGSWLKNNTY